MEKKIVDYTLVKKLYKVQGNIIKGSFFKSYQPFSGLVMICNSTYAFDTLENKKRSPISSIVVEDNGNIHINANYEISSWEIADDKEYKKFISLLGKKNFTFALNSREHEYGLSSNKKVETIIEWVLKYKDPSKVKFICQNSIMSRKEIEDMELDKGMAILDFYDNGYSYMSTDPISKETFLEIADEMISMPFKWSYRNVQVVEQDNNFYIRCLIGKNKHWSEQSNS